MTRTSKRHDHTSTATYKPTRMPSAYGHYLHQLRDFKVLDKSVELDLARRWRDEDDAQALEKLIRCNLKLVVKIAGEYHSHNQTTLDLIQEGNLGLMIAAERFDPERGVRFASYAQWWIRARIMHLIMSQHRVVRLGTTRAQRKLFFNLRKAERRLRQHGRPPTPEQIADHLEVAVDDVIEVQRRMNHRALSLDAPLGEESNTTRGDLLADDQPRVDDIVADRQRWERFRTHLDAFQGQLQGRDVKIWHERVIAEEPLTLRELGERFGVSRERIRQLHVRLVRKFKSYITTQQDTPPTD